MDASEAIVRRFYEELWNRWELEAAAEIVTADVRFRGSLGTECDGREELLDYVETVRGAFPDWHNRIDEMIVSPSRVVARLTWTGTHSGPLAGVEPTGARVEYEGAAIFRLRDGLIAEAWVVGDSQRLWRALGGGD